MRAELDTGSSLKAALRPVAQPQLVREQAFESVKQAIIKGQLRPGTRLTERELCESLGVSRPVVREMIRRLEAERLVEATTNRGLRVTTLSYKTAREIYDLRAAVEVLLTHDFIARASDEDIAMLNALLDEIRTMLTTPDPQYFVDIMDRYYTHMMRVADNAVAADVLSILYARVSMLRFKAMEEPGRIEASVHEIEMMIRCVMARDAEGAEAGVRRYVTAARDAALRQIASGASAKA